jgi:PPOX class probable F420-dependent enzyme
MKECMNSAERKEFVRSHRTGVFGYNRKNDGPSMSIVYYMMDGADDMLISTMAERGKAAAVRRNPKVSLCVLDEKWPPTYLQVYCNARIDATMESDPQAVVDCMMRLYAVMAGKPMAEAARANAEETCRREKRVIVRLTPYATFETPPRHVYSAQDTVGLTHWVGQLMPWN